MAYATYAGGSYRDAVTREARSPAYQAYQVLHVAYVVAPLIAGLDKFTNYLATWDNYLAPVVAQMLKISVEQPQEILYSNYVDAVWFYTRKPVSLLPFAYF